MISPSWTPTAASRAEATWLRIQEKPSSVVLVRGTSTTLAAQTVRLEYGNQMPSESQGGAGASSKQGLIVFGVRDHETVADTNIQRGDRFAVSGSQYRVIAVIPTLGEIQAMCEVLS